jgi:hypothetical protein
MNKEYNYLFLIASEYGNYMFADISNMPNVKIINKIVLSNNWILNKLLKLYLSNKLNNKINIPLKEIVYRKLFKGIKFDADRTLCVVISNPWYDKQLIHYFEKNYTHPKFILRFIDTVGLQLKNNKQMSIDVMNKMDGVLVYNEDDAQKYEFTYCPAVYSKLDESKLPKLEHSDVVFVGAAKDRLDEIHAIYKKLTDADLKCDFYITGVDEEKRIYQGITYADKKMSFTNYMAHELASDCIIEILQHNTSGRTLRMMEAVIYNKKLITNCSEIINMKYNNPNNVLVFNSVDDIDLSFFDYSVVDYGYEGDFSPVHILDCISNVVNQK